MEKVLICLFVPAVQEWFDLFAPTDVPVASLISLLSGGVSELCGGRYAPSQPGLLTLREPELLLAPEKTLADYGVCDGAQLILF